MIQYLNKFLGDTQLCKDKDRGQEKLILPDCGFCCLKFPETDYNPIFPSPLGPKFRQSFSPFHAKICWRLYERAIGGPFVPNTLLLFYN
jgi:hypothetical protein